MGKVGEVYRLDFLVGAGASSVDVGGDSTAGTDFRSAERGASAFSPWVPARGLNGDSEGAILAPR